MNKIHKSQYNEALGTWVAVPEFAKSRGRQANSVSGGISMDTALPKFAFSALTVAVLQVISPTVLADNEPKFGTLAPSSINLTPCRSAGNAILCSKNNSNTVGYVEGGDSKTGAILLGIGGGYARMSTVVGNHTYSNAEDSIAVGHDSFISKNDTVHADGTVDALDGGNSISVGAYNSIHTANTLALGNHITKTKENSIFLGNDTAYIPERSNPADSNSIGAKNAKDENDTSYAGMTKLDSAVSAGGSKVVGVVSVGNENATRRIQGVAPGLVAKDSTDAINGGQLAAAYKKIDGNTKNIAGNTKNIAGNTTKIDGNTKNIAGNTTKIDGNTTKIDNIDKRTTVLEQGWKIFNPENPNKAFAVKAKDTVKFTGDEHTTVKVAQVKDSDNDKQTITTVTVGLNESDIIVHPPVVYTDKDGNILRKVDGKWYKAEDFQPDGKLNSSANKVDEIVASLRNPSEPDNQRGTAYKLTNVAPGDISKDSTDAVNGSQLYSAKKAIESGRVFAGDVGGDEKVTVALGETLNIKGGASASALSDKENIGVIADDKAKVLKIRLNKNLSGLDSIALGSDADKPNTKLTNNGITIYSASGDDISLTDNGLDNGNKTITNVADGKEDTDAVNVRQLQKVENKLFEGFTISDGTHKHDVKSGEEITFKGGEKTSVLVSGSTVTIGLDNDTRDKLSEIVKTLVGNFDSSATPDKDGKTHLVGGYTGLSGKPSTTEIEEKLSSENLAVIQGDDGNSLAVVMAKDPTFRKLSATDSITVGGSGSGKPITINQKPGRIEGLTNINLKNLDDGSKGTAATEAQLGVLNKKVEGNTTNITNNTKNITKNADVISSGRLFAGDDDKEVKVGLGETLNLKGDASASALSDEANIGVIADKDAKGLKIRLNKNLSGLDSIALGSDADKPNTKLTNNGIIIHPASGDKISLTDNGLDNGNKKITHVDKGLVDDSSTDAINGSQLHNIVTSLGGGAGFSKGTYTPPKYVITTTPAKPEDVAALVGDDHPADNVDDALKKLNAYVNQGFLIRDASNNNYQVIPGRTVTFNGTTETVVTVGKDNDGNGTVTVGLAKDAVDKINGSVQKLAGNVGTASPDKAGITHIEGAYQPKSGLLSGDMDKDGLSAKNIAVVGRDEHTLNVAMSESPDFHKITATGTTVNPDLGKANVITVDGDTGHIDGLTNVTLDSLPTSDEIASGKIKTSKAATEAQLRRVIDQATKNGVVINKGRTFKGDDDKAVTVGLGETLNITGGAKPDELSQANNLGVVQDASNGLKVKLNKNISGLDSVALGTDAAKPTTKLDGNGITITPKDSKKAPVSLTDAGLNNGMNKITNVADGVDDNDAVNVSQLKHIKTEVTEIHNKIYNGWNLSVVDADGSDKYGMVESDGRVAFDSRPTDTVIARSVASKPHKNIHIGIDRSTGKQTVFFDLDKDIKVESVTTGGSMVNNDGLSTGNGEGPAVRSDGIDMKRHKIRSLSPGEISATSEDGVNGSQLYAVADAINKSIGGDTKVTYEGDKPTFIFNNIGGTGKSTIDEAIKSIKAKNDPTTVKSIDKSIVVNNVNEGKEAAPSYEVSLAPVVDVDKSLTVANKVTINNNGINAGNTKITNVADGRIAPDSQDAVNGRQLYKVAQNINDMDTRARSGIASAMAAAGLPQAYLPGKSMVSAAASHYRGENAIAVGVSSISDNGKWLVKADANANRKDFGVSLGVGYQW